MPECSMHVCTVNRCWLTQNILITFLVKNSTMVSLYSPSQRIYIYKEETAAPFVFTSSVFCIRKPEAVRKTTPCRARNYKEEFFSREFYSGHFNTLSRGRGEGPHMRSERCTLQSRTLQLYRFEPSRVLPNLSIMNLCFQDN